MFRRVFAFILAFSICVAPVCAQPAEVVSCQKAFLLEQQGQVDEALSIVNGVLQTHPDEPMALCLRGLIEFQDKKNFAGAKEFLEKAVAVAPNHPDVYSFRGRYELANGEPAKALADFDKAVHMVPDGGGSGIYYWGRGEAHRKLRHHDLAMADLDKASKLVPQFAQVWNSRAVLLHDMDRDEEAIPDFTKAIGLKPCAEFYKNRSEAYAALGQYDAALNDASQAVAMDPKNTDLLEHRAHIYYLAGKFNNAIDDLDAAFSKDPSNPLGALIRGAMLIREQKYEEAIVQLNKALVAAPGDEHILALRAMCNVRMFKYDLAKKDLETILKTNPGDAELWAVHAELNVAQGKYDDAIHDCNNVLAIGNPKKWTPEKAQACLFRADALMHQGRYQDAIDDVTAVLPLTKKMLNDHDRDHAAHILRESHHALAALESAKSDKTLVRAAGTYLMQGDAKSKMLDGLFAHQIPTKHFLFLSNLPEARMLYYARFAEAFMDLTNREFTKVQDAPLTRVYLVGNIKDFRDFCKSHDFETSQVLAAYFIRQNSLVVSDEVGVGVLAHEIMHKIQHDNFDMMEMWALEGIATYFEQFYGYYDGNKLVAKFGFHNPERFKQAKPGLTKMTLREVLEIRNPEPYESVEQLAVLFLHENGKFKIYLDLLRANEKTAFKSYFEAAMNSTAEELEPKWQAYLKKVDSEKDQILKLAPAEVYEAKAPYDQLASAGFMGDPITTALVAAAAAKAAVVKAASTGGGGGATSSIASLQEKNKVTVKASKETIDAFMRRGNVSKQQNDWVGAAREYNQVLQFAPGNAAALFGRGLAFNRLKETDKALADLNAVAKLDPSIPGLQYELGLALFRKGEHGPAVAALSAALVKMPKNTQILECRAQAYLKEGKAKESLADCQTLVELNPSNPQNKARRAEALMAMDKWSEAASDYSELLVDHPRLAPLLCARGYCKEHLHSFDGAMADYNRALEIDPKYAVAYERRAAAYSLKGDTFRAMDDIKQALALNPKAMEAMVLQARLLLDLGDTKEAMVVADKVIDTEPKFFGGYMIRSAIKLNEQKDFPGALSDAQKAVELKKTAQSVFYRSVANRANGKIAESKTDAQESFKLQSDFAENVYNIGWLQAMEGDFAGALTKFEEAQKLNKKVGNQMCSSTTRALIMLCQQKPDEALKALEESRNERGENAGYAGLIGWIAEMKKGNKTRANEWLVWAKERTSVGNAKWVDALLDHMNGQMGWNDLEKLADTPVRQTEAHVYDAYRLLSLGQKDKAKTQMEWAKDKGTSLTTEYLLALVESKRLADLQP